MSHSTKKLEIISDLFGNYRNYCYLSEFTILLFDALRFVGKLIVLYY